MSSPATRRAQEQFTRTQLLNPITHGFFLARQRRHLDDLLTHPRTIDPQALQELCFAGRYAPVRQALQTDILTAVHQQGHRPCIDALRIVLVVHAPAPGDIMWLLLGACHDAVGEHHEAQAVYANAVDMPELSTR